MDEMIDLAPAARGALVLVVDADPMFGLMLEACLDFEGARVEVVGTVAEGRAAVRAELSGLVVERMLPDGDGLDLLPLVAERCPQLPVVVCSEFEDDQPGTRGDWPGARVAWAGKGDLARITEVLGLEPEHDHLPADRLMHISALDLGDEAEANADTDADAPGSAPPA